MCKLTTLLVLSLCSLSFAQNELVQWKFSPSVVDFDSTFVLTVTCDKPISEVSGIFSPRIGFPGEYLTISRNAKRFLRDDGVFPDAVAGDNVWTDGPFSLNGPMPLRASEFLRFYKYPSYVPGLECGDVCVCSLDVKFQDGEQYQFFPAFVGLLSSSFPVPQKYEVGSLTLTRNVVNIVSPHCDVQQFLRGQGNIKRLTNVLFSQLSDSCDFWVFFSTKKLEHRFGNNFHFNFHSGGEMILKRDFSVAGNDAFDISETYGSYSHRARGLIFLDVVGRGVVINTLLHEVMHAWGVVLRPELHVDARGNQDVLHYNPRSNFGSLIGGFKWSEGQNFDCSNGRNRSIQASIFEQFLMGNAELVDLPDVLIYNSNISPPLRICGRTMTQEDIECRFSAKDVFGDRTGPPVSRLSFGFVVESSEPLTDVEWIFYDRLASWVFLPIDEPVNCGFNWNPIGKFFGQKVEVVNGLSVMGDRDWNGVVDKDEFEGFRECRSGPSVSVAVGCELYDFDRDGDVDMDDFGEFQVLRR